MTEESQSIDLESVAEVTTASNTAIVTDAVQQSAPEPEPTPAPTKTDLLIQELSQFPNKEAVTKEVVLDLAKKYKCSSTLVSKALKKIERFQPDESTTAKEVTVKFEKGTEIVFDPPTETKGDLNKNALSPQVTVQPPVNPVPITPVSPLGQTPRMATLMPVFNHFTTAAVSEGLEMLVGKVLGEGDDGKPLFSEEEEAMLGVLVPENITKFTGSQLNDSNIVEGTDAVMGLTAAFRLIKRKQEAKAKRLIPPQQSTPPPQAPAPAPEQKQELPHLADLPNPEPAFQKGQKPNYMKYL
jgi:hypothetical protein